jgi:hypothetical protein
MGKPLGTIFLLIFSLALAGWLLLPMEPIEDGENVVAIVERYFEARGKRVKSVY